MAKKTSKKITTVHEHPLHVPISKKNPDGMTTRHQHLRRLKGTYLNREDIDAVFKNYDRKSLIYPTKGKLIDKDADKYDDLIAVWTDYFNKKFNANPPLDPDVVKALMSSESNFAADPAGNSKATGILQITPDTFKHLKNPEGEVKDFIFKGILKRDLKDPSVNIPMGIRWLYRKRRLAEGKLGRAPTHEEIILEYKGLLKSKSLYKDTGLENYRREYAKLKKK